MKTDKNPHALKLAATAGLTFACLASPARSQDDQATEPYQLEDFATVANRFELPLDRIGSSVEVITEHDLTITNQSFLLDAIRTTPGFNVRNNGGPGGTFGLTTRGLNTNRPTVLIDGIEVSNPASGQIINLGNLFGANINRVEILKGAQSSLYGADAIAGVISVETGGQVGGSANFSIGSFDTYEANIGYGDVQGAFSYSVNANHYQSEGFSVQDPNFGEAWADDDEYENTSVSTKVDYQANENTKVYFSAYYTESHAEFDPGNPDYIFGDAFADNYTDTDQLFAKIGTSFQIADNWESQIDATYTELDSVTNSSYPATTQGTRVKLSWQNTIQAGENWNVIAGIERETEKEDVQDLERDDESIYMENIIAINENLDWTLGARYDDNEDYGSETTYRSTFSYRIDDINTRIHGSYGTSFQAPTFYQLTNASYGNPDLKSESGTGWDLGIEKSFVDQQLSISSTLFDYDITDKIVWDSSNQANVPDRPWGSYGNVDRYKSTGIETAANWYATEDLNLKLAYTYASAEYEDATEAERVPRNTYSLGANWSGMEDTLNLNASAIYTGSQYSLRGDTEKQPSYTVLNLAARYKVSELVTLWARIDNVFDKEYEEIAGYQTPGASYYTGLHLKF